MTPTREQLLERAIQRVMDYDANTDILHGTGLLDDLAAALAPQEAAPMPPIEVGDWVQFLDCDPHELHDSRWVEHARSWAAKGEITEIRKANGTVWRRP